MITKTRLKEVLFYNSTSGLFTWLIDVKGSRGRYGVAGTTNNRGYVSITIDGKRYSAHRLAFLYMEGELPEHHVDHINRDKTDNSWANLRHATEAINNRNRKSNLDFIGVGLHSKSGKWNARVPENNRKGKSLGLYFTHLCACYARHAHDVGLFKSKPKRKYGGI